MPYSEDHIALAAEYALGTLDADERAQAEAMMSADKDFTAVVEAWEQKLGILNQMVGLVEPPAELWDKIRAAIGLSGIAGAAGAAGSPARAVCSRARGARRCGARRFERDPLVRRAAALAQCRRRHVGDRGGAGGADRGRDFAAGFPSRGPSPPSRGRKSSRSGHRLLRRRRRNMSRCCRATAAHPRSFSRWMPRPGILRCAGSMHPPRPARVSSFG